MQTIFTILIKVIKLKRKQTDFDQANFCEMLMYLQCLHYQARDQLHCNRGQTMVKKLSLGWKKGFAVCMCENNIPSQK